jgi:hypothetical protein
LGDTGLKYQIISGDGCDIADPVSASAEIAVHSTGPKFGSRGCIQREQKADCGEKLSHEFVN